MPGERAEETKAGWHCANRLLCIASDTIVYTTGCFPQPTDCLVEMRRIELLSESIVSPISPSAATDYF